MDKKYTLGKVAYNPELTKVQKYKLRKILSEKEMIFIETIEGENINIRL